MKVSFYTLGCKVNQYETNLMIKQFKDNNYEITDFNNKSDIYVVNSCSVTNLSTRKTRQMLSKCRKLNDNAVIILVGCYAEELKHSENIDNKLFDIVLGNEEKKHIIQYLNEYIINKNKIFKTNLINSVDKYFEYDKLYVGTNILRESVKIEDGCNNFCSYCIIPYTRGRVRSRSINDIIKEVTNLSLNGTKEIVIVGIEIASYGKDLKEDISLINVIEEINKIQGIERIRLRIYRT